MVSITLEKFAEKYLDRIYTPGILEENQSSGWRQLSKLVKEKATLTEENLRPFHPLTRDFLSENWENIKNLKTNREMEQIQALKKFNKK